MVPVPPPDNLLRFACHCGHKFVAHVDSAGDVIQCPDCGILNDIPTLTDLQSIAPDGTIRLGADPRRPEPTRVADLARTFSRRTDKDLRTTHEDLAAVSAGPLADADRGPIPLADDGPSTPPPKRLPHKYDPETGELIRPVPLAPVPALPVGEIPTAKRALDYALPTTNPLPTLRRVCLELLMPGNIAVWLFTFGFYFFFLLLEALAAGILNLAGLHPRLFSIPLAFLLIAHYANTIDETGPNDRDELPRPMRNFSFGDDLWGPFMQTAAAVFVCFGPAYVCFMLAPDAAWPLALGLALAGLPFFPAALLTAVTAGTYNNLRPDRILRTARAMGRSYVVALILWGAALPLFAYSLLDLFLLPASFRAEHDWVIYLNLPSTRLPAIGLSIFLMHLASWHLGLCYRRFHAYFGWVLQRHTSTRATDEARRAAEVRALRRKPRYLQRP